MTEKIVLDTVNRFSLFKKGDTVTVALSGGADSMCLLSALCSLREKLGITLKAAHLNHLIRGDEALRDQEFVKEQCKKLSVELIIEQADIPRIAKENGESIELTARKVRYEFLNRINKGVVATAHTASDNLETVLFNLTRGSAIEGLCGIPIKRDCFVRPLLFCTREMIEEYCEENDVQFITDSTNLSDEYTRNKIRHQVIPVLKQINPSAEKAALRTVSSLKEISDFLQAEAENYLKSHLLEDKLSLEGFSELNGQVAKRVITEFVKIKDTDISLESCHIESIYNVCIKGGKVSIPKTKFCENKNGWLFIGKEGEKSNNSPQYAVLIDKKSPTFTQNGKKVNNLLLNNLLDCDKIIGSLVVRTRQSGDSIRLLNRGCTKPLTKLYNECGIPLEQRDTLPLIADDKGVVWIYKIGVAQRCAVNSSTKNIYEITVKATESTERKNGVLQG